MGGPISFGPHDPFDSASSSQLDVLLIGRDSSLLTYREHVLQYAGFRTQSVCWKAGSSLPALPSAAVVLLCQTLATEDRSHILKEIRRQGPNAKVVALDSGRLQPDEWHGYTCVLDNLAGPPALIACVRQQLGH